MKVKQLRSVLAEISKQQRTYGNTEHADAAANFAALLQDHDKKTVTAMVKLIRGAIQ